uniref:Uncharacterized protein n=1 Tax=Rhizophora mucronata TaxID=61149 RepID=A0A2P2MPY2_RHIMU
MEMRWSFHSKAATGLSSLGFWFLTAQAIAIPAPRL